MIWYIDALEFVMGLLFANAVPHFVQGISGHRFQTPFASPPGIGESSALVNVLWGLANFVVGLVLFRFFGPSGSEDLPGWLCIGAGVLAMAVGLSLRFEEVRSRPR